MRGKANEFHDVLMSKCDDTFLTLSTSAHISENGNLLWKHQHPLVINIIPNLIFISSLLNPCMRNIIISSDMPASEHPLTLSNK